MDCVKRESNHLKNIMPVGIFLTGGNSLAEFRDNAAERDEIYMMTDYKTSWNFLRRLALNICTYNRKEQLIQNLVLLRSSYFF